MNIVFDLFYEYDGVLYGIFEIEEIFCVLYCLEGIEVVEVKFILFIDERLYFILFFFGIELNDFLYLYLIDFNDYVLCIIEIDGIMENICEVFSCDNICEYEYLLFFNLVVIDGMLYFIYLDDFC